MCQQMTVLAKNEYNQVVFICEHDTLHLVHRHTTILLTRQAFYELNTLLQSRCLANRSGELRCQTSTDGQIELWISQGAFMLTPPELMALGAMVSETAETLRTTPLAQLLKADRSKFWHLPKDAPPSWN